MSTVSSAADRSEVLNHIREDEKFLLVTHEHPDGDALGSLIGMHELLSALGRDSVMWVHPDELPLPYEYSFLALDGLGPDPPVDLEERTIVFLDCGNIDRNPGAPKQNGARNRILNIDHHHDNTRFGAVNHVVPEASCTAEIVWDLSRELGVPFSLPMAEALYVGLVTDTGRFMYRNTGPRAHEMAGDLIEAGVDPFEIYRRIWEGTPPGKLKLLGRALANVERFDEGTLAITFLSVTDFTESQAEESYSEGIIDHLRAMRGTLVAALVRDRIGPGQEGNRKVSLRASDDRIDVSAICREQGGGGHPQAAGFSTTMEWEELVAFLRAELAAQLA